MDPAVRASLESDLNMTHQRFVAAMGRRVPELEIETLESYFGAMSTLVEKLEDPARSLHRVLAELVPEVGALVMQELQRRS